LSPKTRRHNVSDQPVREKEIDVKKDETENSVASRCSTANPMLRLFTTCGRCDLICEACAVVTVKTVHKGYDTVELCQKCLDEMSVMLRMFMENREGQ
jgi:hypothetical protein